jgi:hypothetical protein
MQFFGEAVYDWVRSFSERGSYFGLQFPGLRATFKRLKWKSGPPSLFSKRGAGTMSSIAERLRRGVAALEESAQKRLETNGPRWGYGAELASMAELWDLEDAILCDPDAMKVN